MKTRLFSLFAFFTVSISGYALDESAKAAAAREILDAYHAENPEPGDRSLHIICWRPNDREFATNHRERLTRIMEHIQNFYADELERNGFGRRTFQLNYDEDKLLKIHEAVGSAGFDDYKKPEGQRVAKDCRPVLRAAGINPERETVVIFTNLSNWDPEKNTFFHKSPYYASGNHQRGMAWQLDSPELDTPNLKLKKPIISDGEYGKISLGKHNSIFIGGIAHELGHGLGLPHCRERPDEREAWGTALMGSGNRSYSDELRGEGKGSFITLAHALRLAAHPQFSGSVKGMNLPAKATFSNIKATEKDTHFTLGGKVDSPIPVYGVVAYLDPNGGGDYNSTTETAVPDAEGNFVLDCTALHYKNPLSEIRVVALMANGANSTWRSSYRMKQGKLDISVMKVSTDLTDFVAAFNAGDPAEAGKIMAALPDDSLAKSVAAKIHAAKNPNRTTTALAKIGADVPTVELSTVAPTEVSVGYGKPLYDHLPGENPLLVFGGELFTTGIYAHAPARHVYELPENSTWKTIAGKCGLPDNGRGSVAFEIKADGKSVFKSPVTTSGKIHSFEIKLTGVKKLEFITSDGGDGTGSDWGYWLDTSTLR